MPYISRYMRIGMHIIDSGHAKRVLTYRGKGGNHDYRKINVSIEPMENYIFSERRGFLLSKNIQFSMGTMEIFFLQLT